MVSQPEGTPLPPSVPGGLRYPGGPGDTRVSRPAPPTVIYDEHGGRTVRPNRPTWTIPGPSSGNGQNR